MNQTPSQKLVVGLGCLTGLLVGCGFVTPSLATRGTAIPSPTGEATDTPTFTPSPTIYQTATPTASPSGTPTTAPEQWIEHSVPQIGLVLSYPSAMEVVSSCAEDYYGVIEGPAGLEWCSLRIDDTDFHGAIEVNNPGFGAWSLENTFEEPIRIGDVNTHYTVGNPSSAVYGEDSSRSHEVLLVTFHRGSDDYYIAFSYLSDDFDQRQLAIGILATTQFLVVH